MNFRVSTYDPLKHEPKPNQFFIQSKGLNAGNQSVTAGLLIAISRMLLKSLQFYGFLKNMTFTLAGALSHF
jgi:hypothetical protein